MVRKAVVAGSWGRSVRSGAWGPGEQALGQKGQQREQAGLRVGAGGGRWDLGLMAVPCPDSGPPRRESLATGQCRFVSLCCPF